MAAAVITPSGAPPEPMTACTPVPITAAAMPGGQVAVADQLDASACLPNFADQLLMARTVEYDDDQVVNASLHAPCDVPQVDGYGGVEFDGVLAGGADYDLLHVAVGSVEQAAFLGCREDSDCSGRAGGAEVGSFERIDGYVDLWNVASVLVGAAYLLAYVEHGSVVAFALADHDGAVHGDGVHGLAHGLGRDLVAERTVSLAHGARRLDGGVFDYTQKFQRQIAFQVLAKILCVGLETGGLGSHDSS